MYGIIIIISTYQQIQYKDRLRERISLVIHFQPVILKRVPRLQVPFPRQQRSQSTDDGSLRWLASYLQEEAVAHGWKCKLHKHRRSRTQIPNPGGVRQQCSHQATMPPTICKMPFLIIYELLLEMPLFSHLSGQLIRLLDGFQRSMDNTVQVFSGRISWIYQKIQLGK